MATSPLLFFSTLFFTTTTAYLWSGEEALLDVKGNPVQPGVEYYMVSAKWGMGGGVKPTTVSSSSSCPTYVGQEPYEVDSGTSVTLRSVNDREAAFIKPNEKVVIQFSQVETCIWSPTVWTVEESDGEKLLVTGGDPPKYPPPVGIGNNMLTFTKNGGSSSYTLSYCRCNLCKQLCDPVSKTWVNGRAILNVVPYGQASDFPVVLVKAGDQSEDLPSLIRSSVTQR